MNENLSGHGPAASVPEEVKRWSWGAFLLSWIWGIGNNTWIALLCFVPFVNLVMPFVLGANGNEFAWRNRRWESLEHFHKVQKAWAVAGVAIVLTLSVGSVALIGGVVSAIYSTVTASEPYKLAIAQLRGNTEAQALLGNDVKSGWISNTSYDQTDGKVDAVIDVSVSGSKGSGQLHITAKKTNSKWWLTACQLQVDGQDKRIDLMENKI